MTYKQKGTYDTKTFHSHNRHNNLLHLYLFTFNIILRLYPNIPSYWRHVKLLHLAWGKKSRNHHLLAQDGVENLRILPQLYSRSFSSKPSVLAFYCYKRYWDKSTFEKVHIFIGFSIHENGMLAHCFWAYSEAVPHGRSSLWRKLVTSPGLGKSRETRRGQSPIFVSRKNSQWSGFSRGLTSRLYCLPYHYGLVTQSLVHKLLGTFTWTIAT